jgi:hypothetical protein
MGRVPCEIELTSDSNRHGRATPSAQPVVCGAHLRHGEHAGFDRLTCPLSFSVITDPHMTGISKLMNSSVLRIMKA